MTTSIAEPPDEPALLDGGLVVPVQAPTLARAVGFERIYAAHYGDVYRYVLGLIAALGHPDLPADVC